MKQKPAVFTVVSVTTTFQEAAEKQTDFRIQERFPQLTKDIVENLKITAVDVIKEAAKNKTLRNAPGIPPILYRWREWGNKNEVSAYIESEFLNDSRSAVDFLSRFVQTGRSMSSGQTLPTVHIYVQLKSIAEFVDLHRLKMLVLVSLDSELTSEQLEAKKLFLRKMERLDSGESTATLCVTTALSSLTAVRIQFFIGRCTKTTWDGSRNRSSAVAIWQFSVI